MLMLKRRKKQKWRRNKNSELDSRRRSSESEKINSIYGICCCDFQFYQTIDNIYCQLNGKTMAEWVDFEFEENVQMCVLKHTYTHSVVR